VNRYSVHVNDGMNDPRALPRRYDSLDDAITRARRWLLDHPAGHWTVMAWPEDGGWGLYEAWSSRADERVRDAARAAHNEVKLTPDVRA
jgi:hypothetical protein